MMHPPDLREKNAEALKLNEYTIDEIIKDANSWFDDLVVPVKNYSRGYKIACKKLADEVISLRKQLEESKKCQRTSAKPCTQAALSVVSSASSSAFSSSSDSEAMTEKCKASSSHA
jgi:hypothetical protein